MVAKRIDETPVYVEDVVQWTGAANKESHESLDEELVEPTDDELCAPIVDEFVKQTARDVGTTPDKGCARHRSQKPRPHSGSKKS